MDSSCEIYLYERGGSFQTHLFHDSQPQGLWDFPGMNGDRYNPWMAVFGVKHMASALSDFDPSVLL